MSIQFATCNRRSALDFIKRVYPSKEITDTPECAGDLLDLVEKDIVRIQDPMMYGNRIQVVAGKKYKGSGVTDKEIQAACMKFHKD